MMHREDKHLTPNEWSLMDCLWTQSPRTGKECVDYMAGSVNWSRSTTLTMLRRMTEKGFISCDNSKGINLYSPLIPRESASENQTVEFLNRVFNGSVSMLVSAFTKKQGLTNEEIDRLYAILEEAKSDD